MQLSGNVSLKECRQTSFHLSSDDSETQSGDHGTVAPPVPIPNTEVKRCCADDSMAIGHVKVGRCQIKQNPVSPCERRVFLLLRDHTCRCLAHVGISSLDRAGEYTGRRVLHRTETSPRGKEQSMLQQGSRRLPHQPTSSNKRTTRPDDVRRAGLNGQVAGNKISCWRQHRSHARQCGCGWRRARRSRRLCRRRSCLCSRP